MVPPNVGIHLFFTFWDEDTFNPRECYMQLIWMENQQWDNFLIKSANIWQEQIIIQKLEWQTSQIPNKS